MLTEPTRPVMGCAQWANLDCNGAVLQQAVLFEKRAFHVLSAVIHQLFTSTLLTWFGPAHRYATILDMDSSCSNISLDTCINRVGVSDDEVAQPWWCQNVSASCWSTVVRSNQSFIDSVGVNGKTWWKHSQNANKREESFCSEFFHCLQVRIWDCCHSLIHLHSRLLMMQLCLTLD